MRKVYSVVLFTLILAALSGLLALPALAGESETPLQPAYKVLPQSLLSTPILITFTSASTVYLPIVVKPQNNFNITSLSIYKKGFITFR